MVKLITTYVIKIAWEAKAELWALVLSNGWIKISTVMGADPSGCAVEGLGLPAFACWNWGV